VRREIRHVSNTGVSTAKNEGSRGPRIIGMNIDKLLKAKPSVDPINNRGDLE